MKILAGVSRETLKRPRDKRNTYMNLINIHITYSEILTLLSKEFRSNFMAKLKYLELLEFHIEPVWIQEDLIAHNTTWHSVGASEY